MTDFKTIAFYLPQYHPTPENNKWWGPGFTEWTNVASARPRFKGHHQPHIPRDLGFYDLRLNETRQAQADLAASYGINGFCYYHYWFSGTRLLDRPLSEVLESGMPKFPFCVCWANENWTRAWDGLDNQIIMRQAYSESESREHISVLLDYFRDDRYIKIEGRPLLLIYRPDSIPQPRRYFLDWRLRVEGAGFAGLHIAAVKNGNVKWDDEEILRNGYDSIVDFQPNKNSFPRASTRSQAALDAAKVLLPDCLYQEFKNRASFVKKVNYRKLVDKAVLQDWPKTYTKFPCVFPSWDNTPRRKTPTVIQNLDPALYEHWLSYALQCVRKYSPEERLVFINAWNEWAEGCHLEPDRKTALGFLEATKRAVTDCAPNERGESTLR